jgi:NADH-quinone oxidoreductase subunit A
MLSSYLPILILAGLALLFAVGSLGVSSLLRPNKPNPVKLSPYECGIVPERTPQGERFPVKFYLVAMLFIIFDVETIFLFPWAVTFRKL